MPLPNGHGAQGFQGPQGFQGFQGISGAQGAQGSQGTQGAQGLQGTQGTRNATGPQGSTGFQGSQGFQGSTGLAGAQGPQGTNGSQGNTGANGSQGSQGVQGTQGFQGTQGNAGFQGPSGSTGAQGPQGFVGPQGPQGFQGFQGISGAQGSQGNAAISNGLFAIGGGSSSISVTNTSIATPPVSVNPSGATTYLLTVSCIQIGAASNSGLRMQIGFQSTLISSAVKIEIDGGTPTSTTSSSRVWASVGLGSTFYTSPSFTTILRTDSTAAFALSSFVQLTSAPGSSVPTFAYWMMTVSAIS